MLNPKDFCAIDHVFYHFSEKLGLSASISSEKCAYCSALNESGRITKSGAIKKEDKSTN